MISIPKQSDKSWEQTNTGELLGNLFSTRNMNFDTKGYAKLARRTNALLYNQVRTKDIVSIGTLDGVTYYMMSSDSGNQDQSFTLDGSTSTIAISPTGSSKFDGIIWQGRWYVTQDTTFQYFDGTSWTTSLGTLTTLKYHPMGIHEGLNYLAIGDGNLVKLYNTSHSLQTTVTLPADFEVIWIRYNNNFLYIGTRNIRGADSVLFVSDGTSSIANYGIKVPSAYYTFSGCIYQGVLVVMASTGQLLKYNGQGFDEIAHLPVYDTPYTWYNGSGFDTGKVAQRGMIARGDKIFINLDGFIASPNSIQLPNQPSGLWCYDPKVGLYHRAGLSYDQTVNPSFVSASSTTHMITTSSFTAPTGTKVFVKSTDIGGLSGGSFYYLIWLTTTTFRLAASYNNAIAGTEIVLTSNGSTFNMFVHPDDNSGETMNGAYQPGALMVIEDTNTTISANKEYVASQFLFGAATVSSSSGIGAYTLQTFTTGENTGSIVTTKIQSSDVKDTWSHIFSKYDRLFQGNDKILIKYRTSSKEGYPVLINSNCTWVTASSFTTTIDLSLVSTGDELSITAGRGAGSLTHISSLTNNAGTWTVVIDESVPTVTAGDVFTFGMIDNWIKKDSITSADDTYKNTSIGVATKWIQLKFKVRGVSEPYIEEIQVINKQYIPSN